MGTTIQSKVNNQNTQLSQHEVNKRQMMGLIKSMEGEIAKALPSVITPERFARIATTALTTTPKLADCTPMSFVGALLQAAQLGVEPNSSLGQAYLIPFDNRKTGLSEVQFILGYRGVIDLAYRSGEVETVQAHIVYENDKFEYAFGLKPELTHIPAKSDRGPAAYVYAVFTTKSGGYGFEVMSMEDAKEHAKKYSKSYGNGPWQSNFEEMAKKTVLKKALKYAPLRSDFVRGVSADESIKTYKSGDDTFKDILSAPNEMPIDVDYTESEDADGSTDNAEQPGT